MLNSFDFVAAYEKWSSVLIQPFAGSSPGRGRVGLCLVAVGVPVPCTGPFLALAANPVTGCWKRSITRIHVSMSSSCSRDEIADFFCVCVWK